MEDIYISKADTYIEQTSFPECYEFRNEKKKYLYKNLNTSFSFIKRRECL